MSAGLITFWVVFGLVVFIALATSLKTIRPISRGLVERFGKYKRFANPGLHFILPYGLETLRKVNITEMMVDVGGQEIITKDALNASVDAQVYFKVKPDEQNVKASEYNVYNYKIQIVALARTTLRNIIGTMNLMEANSERDRINRSLYDQLTEETRSWGIEIVRTELKEINPPHNVQDAMNDVVVASNKKTAAVDFANAVETEADGRRRAVIKAAEGDKQSRVLVAEGEAKAIELVYTASQTFFKAEAQTLKQLEVAEAAMANNSKIVIPAGQTLVNVMGDLAGITKK